jgi:hypothetical protein
MGLFCAMVVWDANNRAMANDKEQHIFFILVTIVPEVNETIIISRMQNCTAGNWPCKMLSKMHLFNLLVAIPGFKLPICK